MKKHSVSVNDIYTKSIAIHKQYGTSTDDVHFIDEGYKKLAEFLTKYPEVFYVWNDDLDPEIMEADEILGFLKSIRPGILASANWWNWSKKGNPYADIAVTEMRHFPEGNNSVGETCWKLEDKWFWNGETESKSATRIVKLLRKVNNNYANFLLNIGPDRNGKIIESNIMTLNEVGESWIRKYK